MKFGARFQESVDKLKNIFLARQRLINRKVIEEYEKEIFACENSNVKLINFWNGLTDTSDFWFSRFVKSRLQVENKRNCELFFFSVFGPRDKLYIDSKRPKVFYTGENVELFPAYIDHCLGDTDLSLGFEYISHPSYLRFPLWLLYFFEPDMDYYAIQRKLNILSNRDLGRQTRKFCALISRHDNGGIRSRIADLLEQVDDMDYGGLFRNNTQALWSDCKNDKNQFLENYKFNVCPENSNKNGYVTEKIFEAIQAGCIPIYWGSNSNPEPEILNKNSILFYKEGFEVELKESVCELHSNPLKYIEFICQERFKPHAAEYIWELFNCLEEKLRELLRNT